MDDSLCMYISRGHYTIKVRIYKLRCTSIIEDCFIFKLANSADADEMLFKGF